MQTPRDDGDNRYFNHIKIQGSNNSHKYGSAEVSNFSAGEVKPRYVPPQRRSQAVHAVMGGHSGMDQAGFGLERPDSAMSEEGGVSLTHQKVSGECKGSPTLTKSDLFDGVPKHRPTGFSWKSLDMSDLYEGSMMDGTVDPGNRRRAATEKGDYEMRRAPVYGVIGEPLPQAPPMFQAPTMPPPPRPRAPMPATKAQLDSLAEIARATPKLSPQEYSALLAKSHHDMFDSRLHFTLRDNNYAFGIQGLRDPSLASNPGSYGSSYIGRNSSSLSHSSTATQIDSVVSQSEASRLADLIRSGACEFGNNYPGAEDRYKIYGPGPVREPNTVRKYRPHIPGHRSAASVNPLSSAIDPATALVASREQSIKGNAVVFLGLDTKPLPQWWFAIVTGAKPPLEVVFDALPFMEACRFAKPSCAGVVRIINIPYDTPRAEVIALLGHNAKLISQPEGTPFFAAHVIVERSTGKTMDAFVELASYVDALGVIKTFQRRKADGRNAKIGNRDIDVELSSQEEMMQEMFPHAKNVTWVSSTPVVSDGREYYYAGVLSSGFTGFLSVEEIIMMTKHIETPHRSPFAQRFVVRIYDYFISTLHKYPWFADERVPMKERRVLFDAASTIIRVGMCVVRRQTGSGPPEKGQPTITTLKELTVAVLTCPGFSENQKAAFTLQLCKGGFPQLANSHGMNVRFGGTHDAANLWPFQVLVRDPKAPEPLIHYFFSLLREACPREPPASISLTDRHRMRQVAMASSPFGKLDIQYGVANTIGEVGRVELQYIEAALSKVLPRATDF